METTTSGLDVAKCVFHAQGLIRCKAVLRRKRQRAGVLTFFGSTPRCMVGTEACSTPITGREHGQRSAGVLVGIP